MTRALCGCLVAALVATAGCGVDEDALVCSPGKTRDGTSCIAQATESDLIMLEGDAREVGPCTTSEDCPAAYACDRSLPMPVCVVACTHPAAYPCATGFVCTVAGLCVTPGTALPGQACALETGCVANFACPEAVSDPVCRQVCDVRDGNTCPGDASCVAQAPGFGLCLDE